MADVIRLCTEQDLDEILEVINDAARSGVNLTVLEESGIVTAVSSATTIETSLVSGHRLVHDGGELTWAGGANAGQTVAVRSWSAATSMLTLFLPALHAIQLGDAFTIRPGA